MSMLMTLDIYSLLINKANDSLAQIKVIRA